MRKSRVKAICLYHNPDCSDCARLARLTHRLDWLDRVDISTQIPPAGPLDLGEIAVQDLRSGHTLLGVAATRAVCRQIPAYFLYGVLLHIPFIARGASKKKQGCNDNNCSI